MFANILEFGSAGLKVLATTRDVAERAQTALAGGLARANYINNNNALFGSSQ
jgi:hypothetical protein